MYICCHARGADGSNAAVKASPLPSVPTTTLILSKRKVGDIVKKSLQKDYLIKYDAINIGYAIKSYINTSIYKKRVGQVK